MSSTYRLVFRLQKETKGALQFKETEVNGDPSDRTNQVVGTLYIRKSALDHSIPDAVTVVLTVP